MGVLRELLTTDERAKQREKSRQWENRLNKQREKGRKSKSIKK